MKGFQINLNKLVLGVLLKERVRLLLMFGYFLMVSLVVYGLSTRLLDRNTTQVYANPTIILYFRILVLSIPVIVGLLFGVPLLATEYESGTYRFLFTHGVERSRLVRTMLSVYAVCIFLFGVIISLAINHFFAIQAQAGPITFWSFAIFACQPMLIVPLSLLCFAAGVLLGTLTRRVVPGIAATISLVTLFYLGFQLTLEKSLYLVAQRLKNYSGNPIDAYNNLVEGHDSTHMFQFQFAYAAALTLMSLIFGYFTLPAIKATSIIRRRHKQLNGEGINI